MAQPKLGEGPVFFTVREAAEELRCSPRTIYRYIEAGLLEAKQGPVQMLVPRTSLQDFVDRFPDVR